MKAAIFNSYGDASQMQIASLEKPSVAPNHVLVKIFSVGLNPRDIAIRSGRFKLITGTKFPKITGADFSGLVEQIGEGVSGFKVGDEVFGYFESIKGGVGAEYMSIPVKYIALKPGTISHTTASIMPCAYLTALKALRDKANIQAGQKVVIYGASGGVGTAALQLAKYYKTQVTAVCHSRNKAHCLANGADHVSCYDEQNIFESKESYDIFLQVFSSEGDYYTKAKKLLKSDGIFVCLIPSPAFLLKQVVVKISRTPRFKFLLVKAKPADLQLLAELSSKGILNPQLDSSFPLYKVAEAHKLLEKGGVKGKIALQIVY
jgi:NADPH:quinone reductase-like Zn-dependent oxidoreductase